MDRRRHSRSTKRLEVRFSSGSSSFIGVTSNLSESGLFIRTKRGFAPGSIIDIELTIPDGKVSLLKGLVKWTVKMPLSVKNGMGIELIEKDATYINFLESLAKGTEIPKEDINVPEFQIISCPNCHTKNKVSSNEISRGPKCGRCGASLIV